MALQRKITLRNVKGTALTYAEMDQNLSSFFYSASLSSTDLLLHYTGSTTLGSPYTPTSITIPLNPLLATIQQLTVAGQNVGDIQYRIDNATLGASTLFKWDDINTRLGIGTPTPLATLHITHPDKHKPTSLRITTFTIGPKTATLDYYIGNTLVGTIGKAIGNTTDIYTIVSDLTSNAFTQIGGIKILQTNQRGHGIFTPPNRELTVQGEIGVGLDTTQNQGVIGNIVTPTGVSKVQQNSLPANSTNIGLLIESPKKLSGTVQTGGNVVIGVNSLATNQKYAFSVLTNDITGIYNTPLLTVVANQKIGINNPNPTQALDIVGNTTMTGDINIVGSATILDVQNSLGANSQILTRNSGTGLVQYVENLMPKGGIIMWSGSPTGLPTGWALCDGTGTVNGSPIPDLRERFIVGAGGDNAGIATKIYDRTGAAYGDHTFMYYGSPVQDSIDKVNTNVEHDAYFEFYPNSSDKVGLNGNPTGPYFMYDTGGNYFYYIDTDGKIQKGNTLDTGTRYSGTSTTPFIQTSVSNTPQQPANWSGDLYYAPIEGYSLAYGFYHIYQKKFELNGQVSTGNNLWYWIFDKRHQNYSLVRGTFNGDASIGTQASSVFYYKTGPSTGHSYTPFQEYANPGVPTTDVNNGRPIRFNARRIQISGIAWPERGYNVGEKGGFNDVQITNTTMPNHTHIAQRWSGGFGPTGNGDLSRGYGYKNNTRITSNAGGDQPHENRPPYYALAFIIYTGV